MNTVLARLLQPTPLVVGLVLVLFVAALALLVWAGGVDDTEQLVAPFRWVPGDQLA